MFLSPGVVFQTGLHPATMDCPRAMVYLCRKSPLDRVLDLGTGAGILALAADLNPLCVETTKRKNKGINGLKGSIKVVEGHADDFLNEPADLIVANLQYGLIETLTEKKGFRERSWLIISGLMRSEIKTIQHRLEKYNLQLVHE